MNCGECKHVSWNQIGVQNAEDKIMRHDEAVRYRICESSQTGFRRIHICEYETEDRCHAGEAIPGSIGCGDSVSRRIRE